MIFAFFWYVLDNRKYVARVIILLIMFQCILTACKCTVHIFANLTELYFEQYVCSPFYIYHFLLDINFVNRMYVQWLCVLLLLIWFTGCKSTIAFNKNSLLHNDIINIVGFSRLILRCPLICFNIQEDSALKTISSIVSICSFAYKRSGLFHLQFQVLWFIHGIQLERCYILCNWHAFN